MKINHSDGNSLQKRISRYLESVYNISNGPDQEDHDAALSSIINVQYVYNLSAKDIASGFLHEQVSDALAQAKIDHDKRYAGHVYPSPDETTELFCCRYQGYLRAGDVYVDEVLSPETPKSDGVLRQIIERISGLRVVESSGMLYDLLVSSHTAGEYYPAHLDTEDHTKVLATILIYFSDVSKGGETFFIDANLKAVPRKGSAVMAYNLYSCGERDESALHGFCPISFGEKWVIPLWIKYEHQTHLQCLSEPFLRHEILVNGQSKYTHQNEHR
ncbi:unnamed protein product [Allacma fusca]|uniref:procollagen-proline 4-dioxygenase n=1 Tax=Allacma fusca TaxID=39272 RepID=A0A8J2P9J0_9HEXA|nr:unnamed protein product [Allacma fusca]